MPRIAIAPIQRSVTSWNWRQSRPPGWISVPDFWSGMLTRPPIVPPPCSALSSCCSFTELAVGLTERRLLRGRRNRDGEQERDGQMRR